MSGPGPLPAASAVAEIETRLGKLSGLGGATRVIAQVKTLNLLTVFGESLPEKSDALVGEVVADLAARAFVVGLGPSQPPGSILTRVCSLPCGTPDEPLLVPRVDLWLAPDLGSVARSVVLPLLGARLRTVIYVTAGADRSLVESLSSLGSEVMTDSAEDPALCLWVASSVECSLVDLTFLRGLRWRELIARFFDSAQAGPAVWNIRRVALEQLPSVHGGTLESELLVAWLGSRLDWRTEDGRIYDRTGLPVEVQLGTRKVPGVRAGSLQRFELDAEMPGGALTGVITRDASGGRLCWSLSLAGTATTRQPIAAALPSSYRLASRALGAMHREPAALAALRWLAQWRGQLDPPTRPLQRG
jgi:hypothetical protein